MKTIIQKVIVEVLKEHSICLGTLKTSLSSSDLESKKWWDEIINKTSQRVKGKLLKTSQEETIKMVKEQINEGFRLYSPTSR